MKVLFKLVSMPTVKGKKYPYTAAGKKAAEAAIV